MDFAHLVRAMLLGASAVLSACSLQGPRFAPVSHLAYNEAVQISEHRELLLNLVRLRYMDTPEFLAISSISSQMQFEAQASLLGTFGDDAGDATRLLAPGVGVGYSESPTVTFSPLRGEEFTRRLVAPIELGSLYLLTQYGWSLERSLRLLVEEINGISNALPREAVNAQHAESIKQFAELAHHIQSLHTRELIGISVIERWKPLSGPMPAKQVSAQDLLGASAAGYRFAYEADSASYSLESRAQQYLLRVDRKALGLPDLRAMVTTLGLQEGESAYEIDASSSLNAPRGSAMKIRMRSVLGAMAYVAQGIAVHQDELERGVAAPSALAGWTRGSLLQVQIDDIEPADAFIAVPYRGRWFYVEDRDLESKRTLGLLSSLMRLEIGAGSAQSVPVLTLPVAR